MAVIGGILAILAMLVTFGLQKSHHEQTGVWGPTRSQMRYIRRKARKEGISEHAAYEAWLSSKQRSLGGSAAPTIVPLPTSKPTKRTGRMGWALALFAALVALVVLAWPKTPASRSAVVDAQRVNCRAEALAKATVVRKLSRNDQVQIVREESGWSKVDGSACWIRSDLLRVSK